MLVSQANISIDGVLDIAVPHRLVEVVKKKDLYKFVVSIGLRSADA
jgi:hypothetical protein